MGVNGNISAKIRQVLDETPNHEKLSANEIMELTVKKFPNLKPTRDGFTTGGDIYPSLVYMVRNNYKSKTPNNKNHEPVVKACYDSCSKETQRMIVESYVQSNDTMGPTDLQNLIEKERGVNIHISKISTLRQDYFRSMGIKLTKIGQLTVPATPLAGSTRTGLLERRKDTKNQSNFLSRSDVRTLLEMEERIGHQTIIDFLQSV